MVITIRIGQIAYQYFFTAHSYSYRGTTKSERAREVLPEITISVERGIYRCVRHQPCDYGIYRFGQKIACQAGNQYPSVIIEGQDIPPSFRNGQLDCPILSKGRVRCPVGMVPAQRDAWVADKLPGIVAGIGVVPAPCEQHGTVLVQQQVTEQGRVAAAEPLVQKAVDSKSAVNLPVRQQTPGEDFCRIGILVGFSIIDVPRNDDVAVWQREYFGNHFTIAGQVNGHLALVAEAWVEVAVEVSTDKKKHQPLLAGQGHAAAHQHFIAPIEGRCQAGVVLEPQVQMDFSVRPGRLVELAIWQQPGECKVTRPAPGRVPGKYDFAVVQKKRGVGALVTLVEVYGGDTRNEHILGLSK